jgi:hypothetical protein
MLRTFNIRGLRGTQVPLPGVGLLVPKAHREERVGATDLLEETELLFLGISPWRKEVLAEPEAAQ